MNKILFLIQSYNHKFWLKKIKNNANIFAVFIVAFLYVFLMNQQNITVLEVGHDDLFFVEKANSIISGNWLGEYNHMTLIKLPLLSIFISLAYFIKIPYLLLSTLLYILFCLYFFKVAYHIRKIPAFIAYVLLLFNPYRFVDYYNVRILRSDINAILLVGIFATLFHLFNCKEQNQSKVLILLSTLLGIFSINREENILLLPIITVGIFIFFLKQKSKFAIKKTMLSATIQIIPIIAISLMNLIYYNAAIPTEFHGTWFSKSIKLIATVSSIQNIDMVPVTKETRRLLYRLSPHFQILEYNFEETGVAFNWASNTRYITNKDPHDKEIGGDYFRWAIRDAVAQNGLYSNFITSENYYKALYIETNNLCKSKEIECKKSSINIQKIIQNLFNTLKTTFTFMENRVYFSNGNTYTSENSMVIEKYKAAGLFNNEVQQKNKLPILTTISFLYQKFIFLILIFSVILNQYSKKQFLILGITLFSFATFSLVSAIFGSIAYEEFSKEPLYLSAPITLFMIITAFSLFGSKRDFPHKKSA